MPDWETLRDRRRVLVEKLEGFKEEMRSLAGKENPSKGDLERLVRVDAAVSKTASELEAVMDEERAELLRLGLGGEVTITRGDNPSGPQIMDRAKTADQVRLSGRETPVELRSVARATIERGEAFRYATEEMKDLAVKTVESSDPGVAEHVVTFGSESYRSAWGLYMADPAAFGAIATDGQRAALRKGFEEARATLQTSGAVLPSPLDPTIHLSSAGVQGTILENVSRRTTSSNTWRGITSAGITASYDAELAEVSDDTPALTGTTITMRKAQAEAIVSVEVYADQPDFGSELARLFADAKVTLDMGKAWNGVAGSDEPVGMWTAIDGGSYEISPTTAESFGNVDIYKLPVAVNARARDRGRYAMELSTYHQIFQQVTPGGTEPEVFQNGLLLGQPYQISSVIDPYSGINPAATADNPILIYGDFGAYFWVDRVGMAVMPPQLLQNSNAMRFDGTLGVYCYWRSGGDILVDGHLAILNIATTA